jgi:hypothetical protein
MPVAGSDNLILPRASRRGGDDQPQESPDALA